MGLVRKIFIKADKTSAEMEEYKRIGKRKDEMLTLYPTTEGQLPRVILKKGILKVDGAEVDRYKSPQTLF